MKWRYDNDVIIVGTDGRNTLGVLRQFGECGKIPFVIMIQPKNEKEYLVVASKYAKRIKIFEENDYVDTKVVEFLVNKLGNKNKKPIIITTTDLACEIVDKNVSKLKEYFYLSSVKEKDHGIEYYLNKYNSFVETKKYGLNVADTYVVNLNGINDIDISRYPIPCILKPKESAHGSKKDIRICKDKKQLQEGLDEFEKLNYKDILLQEYIEYEYEFSIHGYVTKDRAYVPGICKYHHKKKIGTNDYAFVEYIPLDTFSNKEAVNKICEFMKNIGFVGCFVGEAFYKEGKVFFNEMNFRTCCLSYNEVPSGHYIVPEYVVELLGGNATVIHKGRNKRFYSILTFEVVRLWRAKKITLLQLLKELVISKSYEIFCWKDPAPLWARIKLAFSNLKK